MFCFPSSSGDGVGVAAGGTGGGAGGRAGGGGACTASGIEIGPGARAWGASGAASVLIWAGAPDELGSDFSSPTEVDGGMLLFRLPPWVSATQWRRKVHVRGNQECI